MKVFLLGSKNLAVHVLDELVNQGHEVKGVLSRDYEPGMKPWLNELGHRSLKKRAQELNIPVYENADINSEEMVNILAAMDLDLGISVFWGQIIKERLYSLAKLSFYNLHTALIPVNRGSFPMAWAIINQDEYAGITFHKICAGVDNGPVIDRRKIKIEPNETGETLYTKVTEAGIDLFKKNLPKFLDLSFTLTPQDEKTASYNPRGYPYGGHIDPYWNDDKKQRVIRALHFPPFEAHKPEAPKYMAKYSKPSVRILIGFDCDRPRGSFIATEKGGKMGEQKIRSLQRINNDLESLKIPRTNFICGQFLESMCHKFGNETVVNAFNPNSPLVETADHTYSHQVMKVIETRKDKTPLPPKEVEKEYKLNSELFKTIFGTDRFTSRGFRTPLGHRNGLQGELKLLEVLKTVGAKYISSDLRDENNSLHPKLIDPVTKKLRQPYWYPNGMLEIPSIGWQDTVFSKTSGTALFEKAPETYEEIIAYYQGLFKEAKQMAEKIDRDIFLGLVMHPFDNAVYNNGNFFKDLKKAADELQSTFHTYLEVYNHYTNQ